MKWTEELAQTAKALATDRTPRKYREQVDEDVRSRAREFAALAPGYKLQPHQIEYGHCLLQRLDMGYEDPRPSHSAFRAAWDRAWKEQN